MCVHVSMCVYVCAYACLSGERNKGNGGREGEILFQLQKGFVHFRQTKITLQSHVNPGNSINIKINTFISSLV